MAILKLGSSSFISDVGLIADGLIETPTSGDLHWSRREKTLVKRTIIHVAVSSLFEGNRNLITVNNLLNGDLQMLAEDMFKCSREVKDESIKAVLDAGAQPFIPPEQFQGFLHPRFGLHKSSSFSALNEISLQFCNTQKPRSLSIYPLIRLFQGRLNRKI